VMDGESEDGEKDPGSLYQIVSLPGLIYMHVRYAQNSLTTKTYGSSSHEVSTPNNQDLLSEPCVSFRVAW